MNRCTPLRLVRHPSPQLSDDLAGSLPAGRVAPVRAASNSRTYGPRPLDALDWLARDHLTLRRLFNDYDLLLERRGGEADRAQYADRLCARLSLHMQIEEELVYPAARMGSATLARAPLDHGGTTALIERLDQMPLENPDFDATVAVLKARVLPHMYEEEAEIFPLLLRADSGAAAALGGLIAQRLKALEDGPALAGATHWAGGARGWPQAGHLIVP